MPYSTKAAADAHVDTRSGGVVGLQCGLFACVFVRLIDRHFYELFFRRYFFIIEAEMFGQLGRAGSRKMLEYGLGLCRCRASTISEHRRDDPLAPTVGSDLASTPFLVQPFSEISSRGC